MDLQNCFDSPQQQKMERCEIAIPVLLSLCPGCQIRFSKWLAHSLIENGPIFLSKSTEQPAKIIFHLCTQRDCAGSWVAHATAERFHSVSY